MKKVILTIFILVSINAFSQRIITGKIISSITHQPIPYANIGLKKHNVGTLSNIDGSFSLFIPDKLVNDTLVVSSIGFGKKTIPLNALIQIKGLKILLNEKINSLNTIIVVARKEKPTFLELGNPNSNGGTMEMDTVYAGRSVALRIENTTSSFIEKARLKIFRNNLKSFRFRVRLNAIDSLTGQPAEDLLNTSIIVNSSLRNGWIEFNLSELNVEIDKPFYVVFEQILDLEDRIAIANGYKKFLSEHPDKIRRDTIEVDGKKEVDIKFTGGGAIDLAGTYVGISSTKSARNNYISYVRETSFGEWKKVNGIITATVTLRQYPKKNTNIAVQNESQKELAICKAEKISHHFIDQTGVNGMQISVMHKDKIKWSFSSGYADVENQILVTDSTKFRINSISKSMTSLALIKLIGGGKLNLDSPIQNYFPEFPKKTFPITTRQLAGHTAGFRDYDENDLSDYIRTMHYENSIQASKIFENDTLLFKPGTRFAYSTFGWNLIGAIVEKVSGLDYLSYMQSNIWQPLGLKNTCGDNNTVQISNRSRFYEITGEENNLGDFSYKYAGGGILSTANDLVKFGNAMLKRCNEYRK